MFAFTINTTNQPPRNDTTISGSAPRHGISHAARIMAIAVPPPSQPTRKRGGKVRRFFSGAKRLFNKKQRNRAATTAAAAVTADNDNFNAAMASLEELDQFLQVDDTDSACDSADADADDSAAADADTIERALAKVFFEPLPTFTAPQQPAEVAEPAAVVKRAAWTSKRIGRRLFTWL